MGGLAREFSSASGASVECATLAADERIDEERVRRCHRAS